MKYIRKLTIIVCYALVTFIAFYDMFNISVDNELSRIMSYTIAPLLLVGNFLSNNYTFKLILKNKFRLYLYSTIIFVSICHLLSFLKIIELFKWIEVALLILNLISVVIIFIVDYFDTVRIDKEKMTAYYDKLEVQNEEIFEKDLKSDS